MMKKFDRYIMVLVTIVALVGSGCDRLMEEAPVRPAPEAPPTPINLVVQVNDRALDLSWEIADSSAVTGFRIYRADSEESEFYLFDSASDYVKTVTSLPFGQPLRFRVTAVSTTGVEGLPSEEVIAIAGLLSIVLDGGDEYTSDRDVSVRVNAPAPAVYLELSEDPAFAGTPVEPFAISMSFELSDGDGIKTVHARITFADGSVSGGTVSDDIELDTRATIDSVWFSPIGQLFLDGDTIEFYLDAQGELGGTASVAILGAPRIDLLDDGAAPDAAVDDGVYSAYYIVPAAQSVTDGAVSGSFRDLAGNAASAVQSPEQLNIGAVVAPESVLLAVALADSVYAHLTWTENDDDDFASYHMYRSVAPGIDVSADHLRIAIINSRSTLTYDDYLPDSGVFYYRIFVFDTQGLSAGSNEVVVIR